MAEKKVGILIKEARTAAKLSQEKLAAAAGENLTGAMIGKCERGEADLTNAQLKKIAVACGVTQSSLLNAPKNLPENKTASAGKPAAKTAASAKTGTAAKKPAAAAKASSAAKTAAAKKPAAKTAAAAKTSSAAKKPAASAKAPAGATTGMKVTASEKKLVEAYRDAPSDLKKIALKVLRGEYGDTVNSLLGAATSSGSSVVSGGISNVLGDVLNSLLGGK